MNLIKIGNLIINASLLVEAEYKPIESDGRTTPRLEVRFSAPQSEPHVDYKRDYTGNDDASPYTHTLYGEDAAECWRELCARDTRQPKQEDQ
jgi:hypothetical protein